MGMPHAHLEAQRMETTNKLPRTIQRPSLKPPVNVVLSVKELETLEEGVRLLERTEERKTRDKDYSQKTNNRLDQRTGRSVPQQERTTRNKHIRIKETHEQAMQS